MSVNVSAAERIARGDYGVADAVLQSAQQLSRFIETLPSHKRSSHGETFV
jgi:hypothetical protein